MNKVKPNNCAPRHRKRITLLSINTESMLGTMKTTHILVLLVLISAGLAAQDKPTSAFEVASVKPAKNPDGYIVIDFSDGGRFHAIASPLMFIRLAYSLQDFQIVGTPGWASSTPFEISAKAEGNPPRPESLAMLQHLLAERFKLAVHFETRQQPTYALVRSGRDKGIRRRPTEVDCAVLGVNPPPVPPSSKEWCGLRGTGPRRVTGQGASMTELAGLLSGFPILEAPVLDETGLAGRYDFIFDWNSDRTSAQEFADAPSVFAALDEQLGLKLERRRGPVPILVIDHIEHPTPDWASSGSSRMGFPMQTRSSPQAGYQALGNVLRIFPIAWQFRGEHAIFQRCP